jgi:antitoxin component of RelBE/YafQ-DinJ toxin-antitoxin module
MKKRLSSENLTIRPTAEDKKLIEKLCKQLGVSVSQIVRLGLRALATKEGVAA